MSRGPILITGATGFLGMELLVRVLEHTDRDVVALVRAPGDAQARARMDGVLDTLWRPGTRRAIRRRVRAVAADLELPGMGMSGVARDRIVNEVEAIAHCAASVSFTQTLEEARRINVGGTRAVMSLAKETADRGSLERVVHVSTAYVAGMREGEVREAQGDEGQDFRNTYERTKLEAEAVVHDAGLPTAILRPSIVVGDSATGWTPAFNVIYWPLLAFARGLLPALPADPDARVDIVSIDTVADALMTLLQGPRRRETLHAVAGDDAPTCGELATMAAEAFGRTPPPFVGPGEDPKSEQRAGAFLPYFRMQLHFDATRGRALGFRGRPIAEYFSTLMDYAREANWGKTPQPRWAVEQAERVAA